MYRERKEGAHRSRSILRGDGVGGEDGPGGARVLHELAVVEYLVDGFEGEGTDGRGGEGRGRRAHRRVEHRVLRGLHSRYRF